MVEAPLALVTGAARRIGAAIAAELAARGYAVAVHYRSSGESAAALIGQIRDGGGEASGFQADLAVEDELGNLLPAVEAGFGRPVSVLVNNASLFHQDGFADFERAGFLAHVDVNALAPVRLAQAMASRLPEGEGGNIVNIIDQRVSDPGVDFFTYTLAKSMLWTATVMMAKALAPSVRVNAVAPGPTLQNEYQTAKEFAAEQSAVPLGRGPEPEEIAKAVWYLLSLRSVTGAFLPVDGGQHLGVSGL